MKKKVSEIFEGKNSSLKKTFDNITDSQILVPEGWLIQLKELNKKFGDKVDGRSCSDEVVQTYQYLNGFLSSIDTILKYKLTK